MKIYKLIHTKNTQEVIPLEKKETILPTTTTEENLTEGADHTKVVQDCYHEDRDGRPSRETTEEVVAQIPDEKVHTEIEGSRGMEKGIPQEERDHPGIAGSRGMEDKILKWI